MKKIYSQTTERYTYNSMRERSEHINKMIKKGWKVGEQVKTFTGSLTNHDQVEDDDYYIPFAEFYKSNKGVKT